MYSALIIVIVALLFSAFFSGMEIAFTSANKLKLEIDRKQNPIFGRIIRIFTSDAGQYLTTILVGNNIALVIYSTYMTLLIHFVAESWGMPLSDDSVILETLISTIVIIFTAEFTPKAIVKLNPNRYLKIFAVPLLLCYLLLWPIAKVTTWISFCLLKLFGLPVRKEHGLQSFGRIDLENLVEESAEAEEAEPEIKIFQNALDFSDLRVRDCMVPRIDIEAVSIDSSVEQLTERFVETKYSRLFVWDGSIDNIVGYVTTKSLFNQPKSLRDILMQTDYVPETMSADHLLSRFTKRRSSVAVVIDEFGGVAGIISLEDILEEIFGEIEDEHDVPELVERQTGDQEWVLACRLEVDYLNEKYGLDLEESEEYDTLAGFILSRVEGIPKAGEVIKENNVEIRVLRSTSSRVDLAKVRIV